MTEENLTENKKIEEAKEVKTQPLLENKNAKEGSFTTLIIFMLASLFLAGLWDKIPAIKNSIHYVLDPTAGALLSWNLNFGMLIVVLIITALTTVVQKYATDQKTLKELRKEQKEIQNQMKEFKNQPEKMMELQKKQFAMMPKQMKLSMRAIIYTGIPFILFFRWFNDFFIAYLAAGGSKFWLGLGWFWFYLISTLIFSSILRKWWDVV
jgi:uncharacterized membrane protein (DUF106 family)